MVYSIEKAYQYYLNNMSKTPDKRILDAPSFERAFIFFMNILHQESLFFPEIEQFPVIMNSGQSRYLHINRILIKIQ